MGEKSRPQIGTHLPTVRWNISLSGAHNTVVIRWCSQHHRYTDHYDFSHDSDIGVDATSRWDRWAGFGGSSSPVVTADTQLIDSLIARSKQRSLAAHSLPVHSTDALGSSRRHPCSATATTTAPMTATVVDRGATTSFPLWSFHCARHNPPSLHPWWQAAVTPDSHATDGGFQRHYNTGETTSRPVYEI